MELELFCNKLLPVLVSYPFQYYDITSFLVPFFEEERRDSNLSARPRLKEQWALSPLSFYFVLKRTRFGSDTITPVDCSHIHIPGGDRG
jgi:hypothetical protein